MEMFENLVLPLESPENTLKKLLLELHTQHVKVRSIIITLMDEDHDDYMERCQREKAPFHEAIAQIESEILHRFTVLEQRAAKAEQGWAEASEATIGVARHLAKNYGLPENAS